MADFADGLADYADIMKCSICLEILKDEKMLPCSHMFCLECLKGYVRFSREIDCPECRARHRVPEGGVKDYPKNVKLRQFLDKLCPGCSKNPKAGRCPHCIDELCAKCLAQHVEMLRGEVGGHVGRFESLADDGKVAKDTKRERKALKDKEKLLEKQITKQAEDLIKIVRNREKKLKADLKAAFKTENDDLDAQVAKYQETVAKFRSFGKRSDLPKLPVSKLVELRDKWPEWEEQLPCLQQGLAFRASDVQVEFGPSEVGIAMKRNWNVLTGETSDDNNSDLISEPSPRLSRSSLISANTVIGGRRSLNQPFAVAVNKKSIIVADTQNNRIKIFSETGLVIDTFGYQGNGPRDFNHPIGLHISPDGQMFVADTKNNRVKIVDVHGKFVREFGKEGTGPGEFNQPWDVIQDEKKLLYVSDCANNRIQVLTTDGRYVRSIGENKLSNPTGIAIDTGTGDIFVADCENHRIQVFNGKSGKLKSTIGKEGSGAGELSYPDGLVFDRDGNVVVAEWGNHRVQVFSKAGRSLRVVGGHGAGPGEFQNPRGLALMEDGRIVVCDCGNHRLQILQ